jgi:hypothetical protein
LTRNFAGQKPPIPLGPGAKPAYADGQIATAGHPAAMDIGHQVDGLLEAAGAKTEAGR